MIEKKLATNELCFFSGERLYAQSARARFDIQK